MKTRKKIILDEDLAKVGVALRRSAKRAREAAERSNTPLIIFENGRVIKKKIINKKQVAALSRPRNKRKK